VILKDRNSTNGTLVNGDVVKNESRALKDATRSRSDRVPDQVLVPGQARHSPSTPLRFGVPRRADGVYNKRYLDERDRPGVGGARALQDAHLAPDPRRRSLQANQRHARAFAGDRVLRNVAHSIQRSLRKERCSPLRGEEFVVLLRESTLEAAEQCAERMRAARREHDRAVGDEVVRVTISLASRPPPRSRRLGEGPARSRGRAPLPGEAERTEPLVSDA
jgi:hypothetical protein